MSSLTTLARPYARAAFQTAQESNALGEWEQALHFSAMAAEQPNAQSVMGDPALTDEQRVALFTPENAAPTGYDNFLAMLAGYDRLAVLPQIAELYTELKDEAEQTLAVTVRTAFAMDDAYRESLKASLAKRFGKQIELAEEVDESMMGGAVIKAGDLVIDGSVRGKLQRMTTALTK